MAAATMIITQNELKKRKKNSNIIVKHKIWLSNEILFIAQIFLSP